MRITSCFTKKTQVTTVVTSAFHQRMKTMSRKISMAHSDTGTRHTSAVSKSLVGSSSSWLSSSYQLSSGTNDRPDSNHLHMATTTVQWCWEIWDSIALFAYLITYSSILRGLSAVKWALWVNWHMRASCQTTLHRIIANIFTISAVTLQPHLIKTTARSLLSTALIRIFHRKLLIIGT